MRESMKNTDENSLLFALWLCSKGIVEPKPAYNACIFRQTQKPRLGVLAVSNGLLTVQQSIEVLSLQSKNKRPYGENAVEQGFLTEDGLKSILQIQSNSAPTLIESLCRITDLDRKGLLSEQEIFLETELAFGKAPQTAECVAS